MRFQKGKQRLAVVLSLAMTAGMTLPALGGTYVGTPGKTEKEITVEFDANGGSWEDMGETATSSDATTSDATASNAKRKVTFPKGIAGGHDDDGNYYVNFADVNTGSSAADEIIMPTAPSAPKNEEFTGWYYNLGSEDAVVVDEYTPIYNDVTLDAGWMREDAVEAGDFTGLDIKAVGLEAAQTMTVEKSELTEEEAIRLAKANSVIPDGNLEIMDITVDNPNEEFVTITMNVPESIDAEKPIKVLHVLEENKVDVIQPTVNSVNDVATLTFSVNKFSPFIILNATQTHTVRVENVPNGAIIAYTEEEEDGEYVQKYLPIGEDVEIPEGETLFWSGRGYDSEEDFYYELESLDVKSGSKTTTTTEDSYRRIKITDDTVITGHFTAQEYGDADPVEDGIYRVMVSPNRLDAAGPYAGRVWVYKYESSTGRYVRVDDCSVRLATREEVEQADEKWSYLNEHNLNLLKNELFEYDAAKNILTSKASLEEGNYRTAFIVTDAAGDHWPRNAGTINVGYEFNFMLGLVTFDGKYDGYNGSEWLSEILISNVDSLTWKDVEGRFEPSSEFAMWNYTQDGWQTYDQKKYEPDSKLAKFGEKYNFYGAYARMVRTSDGKPYCVNGFYDGSDPEPAPTPTPTPDPDKPTNGGSSSGYSSGGGSSSSAKDYTMHGNWELNGTNWTFKKNSGANAVSEWGLINQKWYYFNEQGYMVTGWQQINSQWYYFETTAGSEQGMMKAGWVMDNFYQAWFYLNPSGTMATGWQQIDGKWYYLNPVSDGRKGAMAANTYVEGYYVGADGAWVQ
ncbi:MAG: hypothetical protein Q4F29_05220 [Lachnospiraceae bacterium]|nr:hypothetical protein [Lachnospiraceae bacterium]